MIDHNQQKKEQERQLLQRWIMSRLLSLVMFTSHGSRILLTFSVGGKRERFKFVNALAFNVLIGAHVGVTSGIFCRFEELSGRK